MSARLDRLAEELANLSPEDRVQRVIKDPSVLDCLPALIAALEGWQLRATSPKTVTVRMPRKSWEARAALAALDADPAGEEV